MAVHIDHTRKAVEVVWDTAVATGHTVIIHATHGDDFSTRTNLVNDGRATLTFPRDYHGDSTVSVTGAKGGTDVGHIKV